MLSALHSFAQKGWEVGGWLGAGWYTGDLVPVFDPLQVGAAGGINIKRNFNERISFSNAINYIHITGDDAKSSNNYQLQRNLNFKSNIVEWTPAIEFNFFPYFHGSSTQFFTPYMYFGFSVLKFNPKSLHGDGETELQPLGTEGATGVNQYNLLIPGLATGFGLKYDFNRKWSLVTTINVRRAFSDYLDDVSTVYAAPSELSDEAEFFANPSPIEGFGSPGTQRGDSRTADTYYFLSVGFLRYFGKIECPSISTPKN